jgi:hypothetical protein
MILPMEEVQLTEQFSKVLAPQVLQSSQPGRAPNPSIERTASSKLESAAHVER